MKPLGLEDQYLDFSAQIETGDKSAPACKYMYDIKQLINSTKHS